jgi:hypothetical protein
VTVRRSPLRGITLVVWFRWCCAVRRLGKAVHAANDAAAIDSMTSRYAHVLPQVMTDAAERIGHALWGET